MSLHFKEVSGSKVEAGDAGLKPGTSARARAIADALEFWQPRTTRPLSNEDGREIVENVTGFFDLLHQWDREARAKVRE